MGTVKIKIMKSYRSHLLIIIRNVLYISSFMTNLISVFLLYKKGIYWHLDDYILHKMRNYLELAVKQMRSNLFVFCTSDLLEFALLSQNSKVNKPDIQTLSY